MTPLYAYSLVPVLSVSLLLLFTAILYGRHLHGLAAYCGAVALWSASLFAVSLQGASGVADRLAQSGAFVVAGFLHCAYEVIGRRRPGLVGFAYAVAAGITAIGIGWPGALYSPADLAAGPLFWPAMVGAVTAAAFPLVELGRALRDAEGERRRRLSRLAIAGGLGFSGAFSNSLLLAHGVATPYPMLAVLASLLILGGLLGSLERAAGRRVLERSLLYAALTALLSAGFLFGILALVESTEGPLGQYRLGAVFLLFMAALAVEPLRRHLQQSLGRRLLRGRAGAEELAEALAVQEARADQHSRLAELGTFASAVAHEVRNPLGVIAAHVRILEGCGADLHTCAAIRAQVERAGRFVDDLLTYGRPRPLELRTIGLPATLRLARSTAAAALGPHAGDVDWRGFDELDDLSIEADAAQLSQVFVALLENAAHALAGVPGGWCRVEHHRSGDEVVISIEDSGAGVPAAIAPRLFLPFVTGRKRTNGQTGTGLGLAIARSIVERHGGRIAYVPAGAGARFEIHLPVLQRLATLGDATVAEDARPA